MAKTRANVQAKLEISAKKKKKGKNSTTGMKKTKLMKEVTGVEPLEFTDEDEDLEAKSNEGKFLKDVSQPPLSPRSSLRAIQQQEEVRTNFAVFLEVNQRFSNEVLQGLQSTPHVLRSEGVVRNLELLFSNLKKASKIKITKDDIDEEVAYWTSSMVWYVLGANPPLSVLEEDKDSVLTGVEPWLVLGDFNEILARDERIGDKARFFPSEFQNCVTDCHLEDVKFSEVQAREKLDEAQKKMHNDLLNVNFQAMELEARKENWGRKKTIGFNGGCSTRASSFKPACCFVGNRIFLEEVKAAVFSIPGIKSPGLDGYSTYFFQDNWELVGTDIYEVVTSFLHYGQLLKEIN
uniref:Uncharacterized protein n=1 Tax=Cannabis sativa TaxID=3483 RepID=A0A803QQ42_CANSA